MKKYSIKKGFEGKKIMRKEGIFCLTESTTQKELKKLYGLGHTEAVEIIEIEDGKEQA